MGGRIALGAVLMAVCVAGLGLGRPAGAQGPSLAINGGARLLLHCAGPADYPGGKPQANPCDAPPAVASTHDIVIEYDGAADTVVAWVYVYHPCGMAMRGVGFGIRYDGVRVVTSGTCADLVYQDGEKMGKWAQNGSEIAFVWKGASPPLLGRLAPVAWFLLERLAPDGYFELYPGVTQMSGSVADTSKIPVQDPVYAYGRIGFGTTAGLMPLEEMDRAAGAWGAVEIRAR